MFQPSIVFHASDDVWRIIYESLARNMPNEFTFTTSDLKVRKIKYHPIILRTESPPNINKISSAPTVFAYCFYCSSKSDYSSKVHNQIIDYYKQFEKRYNTIIPVFINNLSLNKGIFGNASSLEALIKNDYPNVQMITIEKNLSVSTYSIKKLWDSISSHTSQAMTSRIKILTDLVQVPANKKNLETIRHYLRLISIYGFLTFCDLQDSTVQKTFKEIDNHPEFFSCLIKDEELEKPIDAFRISEYNESPLIKEVPSEFAMRLGILRIQVNTNIICKLETNAVEIAWNFYQLLKEKFDSNHNPKILFWIDQFVSEIVRFCSHLKTAKPFFTFIINTYYGQLDQLASTQDFSKIPQFELKSIVQDKEKLTNEKCFTLKCLYDTYLNLKLKRYAICLIPQLSDNDIKNLDFNILISTSLKRYIQYAPSLKYEHLEKVSPEMKIQLANRILSDTSFSKDSNQKEAVKKYSDFGALIFERLFSQEDNIPNFEPFTIHLPISLKANLPNQQLDPSQIAQKKRKASIRNADKLDSPRSRKSSIIINDFNDDDDDQTIQNNTGGYFVNEKISIEFELFCGFPSSFTVSKLKVGLIDQTNEITYLTANNINICDHSVFQATGEFKHPGTLIPHCLVFGDNLTIALPLSNQPIHVESSPPPFRFSLKLPEVLLPGLWQRATINFDVFTTLSSLDVNIAGLNHHANVLTIQQGTEDHFEKREAIKQDEGLSYPDIPIGHHQLNFPIFATKSGVIRVSVSSDNHRSKKSTQFLVSEYLSVKIVYRESTQVAQLTAVSKEHCDLTLTKVEFYQENDNKAIPYEVFGLPAKIDQSSSSLLFLLERPPDTANVWFKQLELAPFNLNLNVEHKDENELRVKELIPQIPTTTLIPLNYQFKY